MLITRGILCAASAVGLMLCGTEDAEEAVPPAGALGSVEVTAAGPDAPAVFVEPAYGGTVVPAGPHNVEIVGRPGGEVDAYLVGPSAPPPETAQISVRLQTPEGPRPVMLTWDPARSSYRGGVRDVELQPGPIDVTLVVDGNPYRGHAPMFVVLAPSSPTIVVEQAPSARTVVVERPSQPVVVVERPSRPVVVIERPEPPRPRVQVVVQGPHHPPPPHVVVRPHHPPGPVIVHRGRPGRTVVVRGDDDDRGRRRHGHRGRRGGDDD